MGINKLPCALLKMKSCARHLVRKSCPVGTNAVEIAVNVDQVNTSVWINLAINNYRASIFVEKCVVHNVGPAEYHVLESAGMEHVVKHVDSYVTNVKGLVCGNVHIYNAQNCVVKCVIENHAMNHVQ